MESLSIRESVTDALRYWEPRRIVYNLVLAAIIIAYFLIGSPTSKLMVTVNGLLVLFLLAVLANVVYCAAYVVDVFAQTSGFRSRWCSYRWILFGIGTAFAAVITRFWALAFFSNPGN